MTDDKTVEVKENKATYYAAVPAEEMGWLTIYHKGYMMDSWRVADSKFFFGRSQIFYTHDIMCGDNFEFEVLTHFSSAFRDSLQLTLTSKDIYTISNISFADCDIDLMS